MRGDSATFRDKETEVPSLSRNKGTTGQAHSLAMRRDEPGQSVNIQDGMRDNQYFSAKFCFRTPFLTLERAFPVFERPFLFSNGLFRFRTP